MTCGEPELDSDISGVDMLQLRRERYERLSENWFDVFRRARIVLNLGYGHRYQFGAAARHYAAPLSSAMRSFKHTNRFFRCHERGCHRDLLTGRRRCLTCP